MTRAKNAKDAKIEFYKKKGVGGGLCELSVLSAIIFLSWFCLTISSSAFTTASEKKGRGGFETRPCL
jgi:hypothetical protein